MFQAFASPLAWGSPGGTGIFLACIGIFFLGTIKFG